ncbi:hypothetical protein CEQ90_04275 [Lewinellaceae bacterium SD302]|nr:hypothetical protein CEQ90_04275 [Lewinellaceae bacterium SD302]
MSLNLFYRLLLLIAFISSLPLTGSGQSAYQPINKTYVDNIQTVRFHVAGFVNSYPLIDLNGSAQLRLSFDDLSEDVKRYTYRVIHCDRNWEPSRLGELEYLDGYAEDNVQEYDFSFRTLAEYVHYDLFFPNRDMDVTKSGNYLLVVYEDEREEKTVITRRFYVVDNRASLNGEVVRATTVKKIHTHQEVDLVANVKQLDLRAPLQELSVAVLQNGRLDNMVTDIIPNLVRGDIVQFNYQGKVSFAGGNEFRNLDLRSIAAPRSEVLDISNEGDRYAMLLASDRPRDQSIFLNYADLNGDFVNFRDDRPVINVAAEFSDGNFDRLNLDFTGDYIMTTFVLKMNQELENDDVYLFGGFTEFQKKDKFMMTWNPTINAYVAQALLKQGFYNYWYVTDRDRIGGVDNNGSEVALSKTEGNFDETENDYITLLYYRPIGGRYDQLVGSTLLNSNVD